MAKRILGIVGSYRKNGAIDSLVTEVLSSAEEQGAETEKIYLLDKGGYRGQISYDYKENLPPSGLEAILHPSSSLLFFNKFLFRLLIENHLLHWKDFRVSPPIRPKFADFPSRLHISLQDEQ